MTCVFCGANGFGGTGWTDVCPTCASSPARQAWYLELHAVDCAMRLEAFGRGLSIDHRAATPELLVRMRALRDPGPNLRARWA